jgi:hypothetical protein
MRSFGRQAGGSPVQPKIFGTGDVMVSYGFSVEGLGLRRAGEFEVMVCLRARTRFFLSFLGGGLRDQGLESMSFSLFLVFM